MAESSYCLYRYTCARCGEVFTDIAKGDHYYGELTARSAGTGQLVYINALADPVFDEVRRLTTMIVAETGLTPTDPRQGAAVQRAYSAACDPCQDGTRFVMGGHPRCPTCGEAHPLSWEHTGEHVTRDVGEPTHRHWLSLTELQRLALVRKEVIDLLSE